MVDLFKKYNFFWNEIKVVMLDKDFIEWDVFKVCFFVVSLSICFYYILRFFRWEIICEKMGIIFVERLWVFEILFFLVYCKSEGEYEKYFDELK